MAGVSRRGFLQGIGAAAAAPVLPALPVAAAPATFTKMQFVWASYYAQMNNACSPAHIMRALDVDPAVAQRLYGEMLRRGVLRPPVAGGIARAAKPTYKGINGHHPTVPSGRPPRARRGARHLDGARIMAVVTRDMYWQLPFRPELAA